MILALLPVSARSDLKSCWKLASIRLFKFDRICDAVAAEWIEDPSKELQRRVMEKAEWKILPKAIDLIANEKITVTDGIVSFK